MKKRNLIIAGSSIIAIMVIALAILGYSMTQNNIVGEKEIAKESEPYSEENVDNEICYVTVEENEESKLNSIKAKEMAKSSAGVTIQQGNIVVSMDTDLTIDSSIANYRTKYGIGETVVVKVYFDKEISTVSETSLYLKFGTGTERKATYSTFSGSVITYRYTIKEGDSGELKLTSLSGNVTDKDNNSIRIGLSQSGSIQYQDTSKIIAETVKPKQTGIITRDSNVINVEFSFDEIVYRRGNNKLEKITVDYIKEIAHAKVGSYVGKGTLSNFEVNEDDGVTKVKYKYTIEDGDNGTLWTGIDWVYDIAGNRVDAVGTDYGGPSITTTETPIAQYAWIDVETAYGYKKVDNQFYLNAGDQIRIGVTYNESVYESANSSDSDFITVGNSKVYTLITFVKGDGTSITRQAICDGNNDTTQGKRYCVYQYVVEENDFFDGTAYVSTQITIPANTVYDNVGHANKQQSIALERGGVLWGNQGYVKETNKIWVDTVAPKLINATQIRAELGTVFKATETMRWGVLFSEPVSEGHVKVRFGNDSGDGKSVEETTNSSDRSGYVAERYFRYIIQEGENGYRSCKYIGYEDKAGNKAIRKATSPDGNPVEFVLEEGWQAHAGYENNQCADTTPPNLSISHAYEEERAISKYTFTLTDNSTAWKKSDGTLMTKGGIAQNSLTLDDINLRNGTILDSTTDSDGNLKTITVLNDKEGTQKIDIKSGAWSDAVGNLAGPTTITTTIDTKKPIILSTDISPDVWTNQDVTIRVNALDETSGIAGYSYNGGEYGAEDTYVVDSESPVTVKIKVKDSSGLESDEKIVTVKNIDKTKPTLLVTKNGNILSINTTDPLSGIERCEVNGTVMGLDDSGNATYNITGNGDIVVTSFDKAGNMNSWKTTITDFDNTAPKIESINLSPSGWTNQDVTLTVYATDDKGIATEGYSFDGGTTWQAPNTKEVTSNSTINVTVKDNKGNVTSREVNVNNIDKDAPTFTLNSEAQGKEKATITISNASDEISGISNCKINGIDVSLIEGSYTFEATQNGTYTVTIFDRAGNSLTKPINITNIDNTVVTDATILYTANGGTYTLSQDSRVNLSDKINVINTAISKIEYAWTQSEEEPSTWTYAGSTTGLSVEYEATKAGKYYLHIKVTDSSGHETTSHSNAFVVKAFPISVDKSVVIKSIQGTNYIILPKESDVNELLGKITSNEYTIKIKNSECTEDRTGKIRTGDVVVAEGTEKYKIYKICVKGDINKDGLINIDDIFQLNQYRLGKIEFDVEQAFVANVDSNEEININDIFQINQYRLGKIENF